MTSYPTPSRRLRLGMVGGGRGGLVGHWHWTGARVSARWDLVAGALSSKPDVALASGRDWKLAEDRIYSDFKEMAKSEASREDGIDAVAICTPNHMHRPVAEVFMDHGIDIICDKPMANSKEDCVLVEASKNRLICVRPRRTFFFFSICLLYFFILGALLLSRVKRAKPRGIRRDKRPY